MGQPRYKQFLASQGVVLDTAVLESSYLSLTLALDFFRWSQASLLLWDEGTVGPKDGRGWGGTGQREARCKNVTTIMFMLAAPVLSLDLEPLCWRGRRGGCRRGGIQAAKPSGFCNNILPPAPTPASASETPEGRPGQSQIRWAEWHWMTYSPHPLASTGPAEAGMGTGTWAEDEVSGYAQF